MIWEPTQRIHEPNIYPMSVEKEAPTIERTTRGLGAEDNSSTPASYNFDFVYAKLRPFNG